MDGHDDARRRGIAVRRGAGAGFIESLGLKQECKGRVSIDGVRPNTPA
jgi:hypothetical protein